MKVMAYGPVSLDKPYIPKIAIFEDGSKRTESGELIECETNILITPYDLPDGCWFAVLKDGSFESFHVEKSGEWAARKASEIILSVRTSTSMDPLDRLSSIRAAAALVKAPLTDLLTAVSLFGGESLHEAFIRMRAKGGRLV